MRRQLITLLALMIVVILLALLILFLASGNVKASNRYRSAVFPSPTASVSVSPTSSSGSQSNSGLDSAIVAALIGLGGVVVGALIAGGFAVYQSRRSSELERKLQEAQHKHEQDMLQFQKEVEKKYKTKEQDEQRKETENHTAKQAMLRARNIDERVAAYRKALREDPRIARLQILDMSQPLEVTNVYIRVRLHQETRAGYELDVAFREAEGSGNPNNLLKAGLVRLEAAIDPDEAMRRHSHCVLVGDPGAGKTTLLKYLTLKAVDNQLLDLPDLPIHVELNAFANSGYRDPLEFAASVWEERYEFPKAEALDYMKGRLKEGKAMLLLDALDETVTGKTREESEESYRLVANSIVDMKTRYNTVPIVVTARKAGYHQRTRLTGFTELEVLDFRPEDIQLFVEKWFAYHSYSEKHGNAEDLNARLQRSPRIQALAANPLLLSLIVIVYEEQLDLPDRRAELYKQCVDTLLTKWDASRDIRRRREFKPEHKRQLLEEVAWHFHRQGQRYFPEQELLTVIAGFLPAVGLSEEQNGQVLEEIAAENGLLKEQAHGWHGFLHLTLQEYFVALYAVEHNELDTVLKHRGDPWWEEAILLYAGQISDAGPLLQRLLEQDRNFLLQEDIFFTNLILAGRCLAARPIVRQVVLREEIISRLFDTLLKTRYSLIQEQVAEALVEIGRPEVNERLLSLLSNDQLDSFVRERIADALGTLGDHSLTPTLLSLLSNDQLDRYVRRSIAAALRTLGDRSVTPTLLSLLSNDQLDLSVGYSIATALGTLGDHSVTPTLLSLLSNDRIDSFVRRSIAAALRTLGDRSVTSTLLSLLSNDQLDSDVRASIATALGTLGDRSLTPTLLSLLSNDQLDRYVRECIAAALGTLGDRSVTPTLLSLLPNGQIAASVRASIADALAQIADDEGSIRALTRIMQISDVADSIHHALWTIGRRVGVRIFMIDKPRGRRVKIVKWGEEPGMSDEI